MAGVPLHPGAFPVPSYTAQQKKLRRMQRSDQASPSSVGTDVDSCGQPFVPMFSPGDGGGGTIHDLNHQSPQFLAQQEEQRQQERQSLTPSFESRLLCQWCGRFCDRNHIQNCDKKIIRCPLCRVMQPVPQYRAHYEACEEYVLAETTRRVALRLDERDEMERRTRETIALEKQIEKQNQEKEKRRERDRIARMVLEEQQRQLAILEAETARQRELNDPLGPPADGPDGVKNKKLTPEELEARQQQLTKEGAVKALASVYRDAPPRGSRPPSSHHGSGPDESSAVMVPAGQRRGSGAAAPPPNSKPIAVPGSSSGAAPAPENKQSTATKSNQGSSKAKTEGNTQHQQQSQGAAGTGAGGETKVCPHCKTAQPLAASATHEKSCPKKMVSCKACGSKLLKSDAKQHLAICPGKA